MNEELVIVGKVINFFGIKGELKILSDFDKVDLAYKVGMSIMIKEEWLTITSVRKHKNYKAILDKLLAHIERHKQALKEEQKIEEEMKGEN